MLSKTMSKRITSSFLVATMVLSSFAWSPINETDAAVKSPALSTKKANLYVGEKLDIKIKNLKAKNISSLTWKVGKKSVVSAKDKASLTSTVTAKKKGKTTITANIKTNKAIKGKTIFKLKANITVKDGYKPVTVDNQADFNKALKTAKKTKIKTALKLKTDDKKKFKIAKGTYDNVVLTVNAPNADVVNNGVFERIEIKAIAKDTWTEQVTGNKFIVKAVAGRIIIPESVQVDEAIIVSDDSNFTIEVLGKVKNLVIDSRSNIKLNVSGEIDELKVDRPAKVDIEGSSTNSISVDIGPNADGTILKSSVTLDAVVNADAEISLSKGAEKTNIKAINESIIIEISNSTATDIGYTTSDGVNKDISSGKKVEIQGDGEVRGENTSPVQSTPTISPVNPISTPSNPSESSNEKQEPTFLGLEFLHNNTGGSIPDQAEIKKYEITETLVDNNQIHVYVTNSSSIMAEISADILLFKDSMQVNVYDCTPNVLTVGAGTNFAFSFFNLNEEFDSYKIRLSVNPYEGTELTELEGVAIAREQSQGKTRYRILSSLHTYDKIEYIIIGRKNGNFTGFAFRGVKEDVCVDVPSYISNYSETEYDVILLNGIISNGESIRLEDGKIQYSEWVQDLYKSVSSEVVGCYGDRTYIKLENKNNLEVTGSGVEAYYYKSDGTFLAKGSTDSYSFDIGKGNCCFVSFDNHGVEYDEVVIYFNNLCSSNKLEPSTSGVTGVVGSSVSEDSMILFPITISATKGFLSTVDYQVVVKREGMVVSCCDYTARNEQAGDTITDKISLTVDNELLSGCTYEVNIKYAVVIDDGAIRDGDVLQISSPESMKLNDGDLTLDGSPVIVRNITYGGGEWSRDIFYLTLKNTLSAGQIYINSAQVYFYDSSNKLVGVKLLSDSANGESAYVDYMPAGNTYLFALVTGLEYSSYRIVIDAKKYPQGMNDAFGNQYLDITIDASDYGDLYKFVATRKESAENISFSSKYIVYGLNESGEIIWSENVNVEFRNLEQKKQIIEFGFPLGSNASYLVCFVRSFNL